MALNNLLTDTASLTTAQAEATTDALIGLLKEDALRGEVYENARFRSGASDDFSIVDVHNVLDALIESLEGSRE